MQTGGNSGKLGEAQTPGRGGPALGEDAAAQALPRVQGSCGELGVRSRLQCSAQVCKSLGSPPPLTRSPRPSVPISEVNIFSSLFGLCLFVCIYF